MGIMITEAAARHILAFLKTAQSRGEKKDQPVRLALKRGGGCGSFTPELVPNAGIIPDEDDVIVCLGLTVICNTSMTPELDGTTIDLEASMSGSRLVYRNLSLDPCGCGKAFSPRDTTSKGD